MSNIDTVTAEDKRRRQRRTDDMNLHDTHDRVIRIEAQLLQWMKSVEERLDRLDSFQKWVVGLLGLSLMGIVVNLLLNRPPL